MRYPKMTMARKMMTREERKSHISPFLSSAWTRRSNAIIERLRKQKERNALRKMYAP